MIYHIKLGYIFLSEKSKVFSCFKSFKALVEKEVGEIFISLQTYKGGEFTSNVFEEFCKTHGTQRQLTATYTPH